MRTRIPTICTSYKHSIQNHPLPFFFKITQIILFLIPILSNFLSNPSNNSYISINILACSKTPFSFFKKVNEILTIQFSLISFRTIPTLLACSTYETLPFHFPPSIFGLSFLASKSKLPVRKNLTWTYEQRRKKKKKKRKKRKNGTQISEAVARYRLSSRQVARDSRNAERI